MDDDGKFFLRVTMNFLLNGNDWCCCSIGLFQIHDPILNLNCNLNDDFFCCYTSESCCSCWTCLHNSAVLMSVLLGFNMKTLRHDENLMLWYQIIVEWYKYVKSDCGKVRTLYGPIKLLLEKHCLGRPFQGYILLTVQ